MFKAISLFFQSITDSKNWLSEPCCESGNNIPVLECDLSYVKKCLLIAERLHESLKCLWKFLCWSTSLDYYCYYGFSYGLSLDNISLKVSDGEEIPLSAFREW